MADLRIALPFDNAPVAAGTTYTAMATVLPLDAARQSRVGVRWYNAASALIATAMGAWTATSLVAPTELRAALVAPAGAVTASLLYEAQAVAYGNRFKLDDLGLVIGDVDAWVVGGELDQQYGFTVERSDDGGDTWVEVRDASLGDPQLPVGALPVATIYDHEAPLNVPVRYRARTRKLVEVA